MGFFSYKLYRLFLSPHGLSVTTVTLGSRLFLILLQINLTRDCLELSPEGDRVCDSLLKNHEESVGSFS